MEHSTNAQRSSVSYGVGLGIGENIYGSTGLTPTWRDIVTEWWNEVNDYAYGPSGNSCESPFGRPVGHFTQVAWECSYYIGCAKATCDGGKTVAVCNYGVQGNLFGDLPFSTTVATRLGKSAAACASGGKRQICRAAPKC